MNLNTSIGNKPMSKRPKGKAIVLAVVIMLISVAAVVGIRYINPKDNKGAAARQATAIARKGDLSVTVSGSGPISSSNKYYLTSNVNGTLTKVYFKDGDKVKAGDLIFEIDDKDTELQIKQLKNSIAQAELTRNSNMKELESAVITAPFDGEVQGIQLKEGDNVSNNGAILTITDKSKLKLLVSFSNTCRNKLYTGQEVDVNAYDTATEELYKVKGRVASISTPIYTADDGNEVYNVVIEINNNGNLKDGMIANAVLNLDGMDFKSKGSSNLSFLRSVSIKAASGGTIKALNAENGQIVGKGDVLAEIDNEELKLAIETSNLKLEDLDTQLETAEEKLLDYKIYAPFDGTFTLSEVKQGNSLNQGNSIKQGDILGSVANYDTMEFSIDVDELDIAKIKLGQPAKVTIDALPETANKSLAGTVSKISVEGTSTNGVSIYPVTIQIEQNEALKGGMNANAEIVVNQKNGVLFVPVDAVSKKNGKSYVRVAAGAGKQGKNAKAEDDSGDNKLEGIEQQIEPKEVKTGISNEEYIEILSGIKEGDAVIVTSSSNSDDLRQMRPNGIGFPIGGSQSGGGNIKRNK